MITLKGMGMMISMRILKIINEKLTITIFWVALLSAQASKIDNI